MPLRKIKLFIQPACSKCPAAKKFAESLKNEIEIEIYDTETPEGLAQASYYQVMSTPSFIVVDEKDEVMKFWPKIPLKNEVLGVLK